MKIVRLLKAASGLPAEERRETLLAASLLAYANLSLKLMPFSKAIAFGSTPVSRTDRRGAEVIGSAIRAVKRASYAVPWRTVCIHQGLALQWMLRRRGLPAILCYGTRQSAGKLQAHVWIKVNDEIVLGGEEAKDFALVAVYPPAEESSTIRPFSNLST
jgi:hypothetical protein